MNVVTGFPLRWPIPVWRRGHPLFVPGVRSVMISFNDLLMHPTIHKACMRRGLRRVFGVSGAFFLDNGAFAVLRTGRAPSLGCYVDFVRRARPDWYPIPFDYIPLANETRSTQRRRFKRTLRLNLEYGRN